MPDIPTAAHIDAATFVRRLNHGFGRVIAFLAASGTRTDDFRDLILHACGHLTAYDTQCESGRPQYLYDIIHATGDPEFYAARTRDMLNSNDKTLYHAQLYGLCGLLARNGGDVASRRAVYERFASNPAGEYRDGAEAIVDMDGVAGYRFIADQLLRAPLDAEDDWEEAYLLQQFEAHLADVGTPNAVWDAAATDAAFAEYLAGVREKRARWTARRNEPAKPRPTYQEIRTAIDDPEENIAPFPQDSKADGEKRPSSAAQRHRWQLIGRRCAPDVLDRVAADLLTEHDRDRLLKLTQIFQTQPFFLAIDRLLDLARSPDTDLRSAARDALSNVHHPRIRALALEIAADEPLDAVLLLQHSATVADAHLIAEIASAEYSDDDHHRIGFIIRQVVATLSTPAFASALIHVYDNGPCTMCRYHTVERLLAMDHLPDWIRDECRHDAYVPTRQLVGL